MESQGYLKHLIPGKFFHDLVQQLKSYLQLLASHLLKRAYIKKESYDFSISFVMGNVIFVPPCYPIYFMLMV